MLCSMLFYIAGTKGVNESSIDINVVVQKQQHEHMANVVMMLSENYLKSRHHMLWLE